MRTRTRLGGLARRIVLPLSLVAAFGAQAVPAPDDLAGPPPYTVNGCPAHEEWTTPLVARTLGISERAVSRAWRKRGVDATALCTMRYDRVQHMAKEMEAPKPGFDQPDKAMAFRALSLRSNDGRIVPGGLARANEQRKALEATSRPKAGGLAPGSPTWTEIGPFSAGGRVRAVLPLTTTRILIGSVSGGLFLTEDAGASWAPVRDLMPNVAISCLVPDPVDPASIYVCTGEGAFNFDAIGGDGIYRITGAGGPPASWSINRLPGSTPSGSGSPWSVVNRLAVLVNPADPGNANNRVIVAATTAGIWRSANGGQSFALVAGNEPGYGGTRRYMDLRAHPQNPANLVAGEHGHNLCPTAGGNCIYEGGAVAFSLDAGLTWSRRAFAGSSRVEVTPVAGAAGTWLALLDNTTAMPGDPNQTPYGGQLFRSTNGGANWSRRDVSGLDALTPAGSVLGAQGWYDMAIWASPDGSRVMAGGVGIRLSLDGGVTFGAPPCGPGQVYEFCPIYAGGLYNIHPDHHAIVPALDYATSGIVYFGQDGGVYKANIGAQATNLPGTAFTAGIFTSLNNSLGITQFHGGAGAGAGAALKVAGGTQDNGSWTWNGSTWSFFHGGDGGESAVDPSNTQFVYGEFQGGIVYRSSIGGAYASPYPVLICEGILDVDCNNGVASGKVNFIAPFMLDPNNPDRMLFGGESVWRSNDVRTSSPGQPTWTAIKGPTQYWYCSQYPEYCTPPWDKTYVSIMAVAPGNPDIAWVGYNDGQIFRTLNATAVSPTWTNIDFAGLASPPRGRMALRILVDPSNAQRVWISFGGYNTGNVIATANGGATWADVHGNLPAAPVRALARHPTQANVIYAGTEVGVFASETGGTAWSAQNEGPGTVSVEELFFVGATTLFASTHGRGMFRATVAPGGVYPAMTIASSKNPSAFGEAVTFTTVVSGPAGIPTGTVTFRDGMGNFSAEIGTATLDGSGTATVTTAALGIGEHRVFPHYSGNAWYSFTSVIDPALPTVAQRVRGPFSGREFNGDGKADILWRNASTGQVYTMLLNGLAVAGGATALVEPNPAWKIVSDADFTGDGVTDILWRNDSTGQVYLMPLANTGTPNGGAVAYTEANAAWKIVHTPDLDGDGKADLVWWNSSSGQVYAMLMNGAAIGAQGLVYTEPDTAWKIVAAGDFAGSGKRNQLLWRNGTTGQVYLMTVTVSGGVFSQTGLHIYSEANTAWKIIGADDFNGDGKSDILWRNGTTGQVYMLLMNGASVASQGLVYTEGNTAWKIVAHGDYNGDGKADLLWRNDTTGQVYMMLMNGLAIASQGLVYTEGNLAWKALGPWEYGLATGTLSSP